VTASSPTPKRNSAVVAVPAILAGLVGVALVGFGVIRLVSSGLDGDASATTVGAVTTTGFVATTAPDTGTSTIPSDVVPGEYQTVTDDTGALSVSVPAEWVDRSGGSWGVDGEIVGVTIGASVDRDAWYAGWGTPGVFVGVTTVGADVFSPDLGDFSDVCSTGSVDSPQIGGYSTVIQYWTDCGDEDSNFTVVLAWPDSFAYTVLMQVITTDQSAVAVTNHLVTTLRYDT
jgi:serine protease Do